MGPAAGAGAVGMVTVFRPPKGTWMRGGAPGTCGAMGGNEGGIGSMLGERDRDGSAAKMDDGGAGAGGDAVVPEADC